MKKAFVTIFLLLIGLSILAALSVNTHIGVLSGVGVSQQFGKFNVGADIESSFPGFAIGEGYMCEQYGDCSYSEGFKYGAKYFVGLDLYTHYPVIDYKGFSILVGADLISGFEIPIRCFDMVLKGSLVLSQQIVKKCSLFVDMNYPLVALMQADGFKKPLIYFPENSWIPILTGWKVGVFVDI